MAVCVSEWTSEATSSMSVSWRSNERVWLCLFKCTVKLVYLGTKYCQESVAASFRPISRATAGQSEGCYPRENIGPEPLLS